jgi:hypothetical protein
LPRLSPYSANRITIDERDLPMDVTIRHRDLQVVPSYRAGTLADYEARRRIGAVLSVRLADGSPSYPTYHHPRATPLSSQTGAAVSSPAIPRRLKKRFRRSVRSCARRSSDRRANVSGSACGCPVHCSAAC